MNIINNYERIKNMTITELSYFLSECNSICDFCVYHFNTQECLTKKCVVGINKWLERIALNDKL